MSLEEIEKELEEQIISSKKKFQRIEEYIAEGLLNEERESEMLKRFRNKLSQVELEDLRERMGDEMRRELNLARTRSIEELRGSMEEQLEQFQKEEMHKLEKTAAKTKDLIHEELQQGVHSLKRDVSSLREQCETGTMTVRRELMEKLEGALRKMESGLARKVDTDVFEQGIGALASVKEGRAGTKVADGLLGVSDAPAQGTSAQLRNDKFFIDQVTEAVQLVVQPEIERRMTIMLDDRSNRLELQLGNKQRSWTIEFEAKLEQTSETVTNKMAERNSENLKKQTHEMVEQLEKKMRESVEREFTKPSSQLMGLVCKELLQTSGSEGSSDFGYALVGCLMKWTERAELQKRETLCRSFMCGIHPEKCFGNEMWSCGLEDARTEYSEQNRAQLQVLEGKYERSKNDVDARCALLERSVREEYANLQDTACIVRIRKNVENVEVKLNTLMVKTSKTGESMCNELEDLRDLAHRCDMALGDGGTVDAKLNIVAGEMARKFSEIEEKVGRMDGFFERFVVEEVSKLLEKCEKKVDGNMKRLGENIAQKQNAKLLEAMKAFGGEIQKMLDKVSTGAYQQESVETKLVDIMQAMLDELAADDDESTLHSGRNRAESNSDESSDVVSKIDSFNVDIPERPKSKNTILDGLKERMSTKQKKTPKKSSFPVPSREAVEKEKRMMRAVGSPKKEATDGVATTVAHAKDEVDGSEAIGVRNSQVALRSLAGPKPEEDETAVDHFRARNVDAAADALDNISKDLLESGAKDLLVENGVAEMGRALKEVSDAVRDAPDLLSRSVERGVVTAAGAELLTYELQQATTELTESAQAVQETLQDRGLTKDLDSIGGEVPQEKCETLKDREATKEFKIATLQQRNTQRRTELYYGEDSLQQKLDNADSFSEGEQSRSSDEPPETVDLSRYQDGLEEPETNSKGSEHGPLTPTAEFIFRCQDNPQDLIARSPASANPMACFNSSEAAWMRERMLNQHRAYVQKNFSPASSSRAHTSPLTELRDAGGSNTVATNMFVSSPQSLSHRVYDNMMTPLALRAGARPLEHPPMGYPPESNRVLYASPAASNRSPVEHPKQYRDMVLSRAHSRLAGQILQDSKTPTDTRLAEGGLQKQPVQVGECNLSPWRDINERTYYVAATTKSKEILGRKNAGGMKAASHEGERLLVETERARIASKPFDPGYLGINPNEKSYDPRILKSRYGLSAGETLSQNNVRSSGSPSARSPSPFAGAYTCGPYGMLVPRKREKPTASGLATEQSMMGDSIALPDSSFMDPVNKQNPVTTLGEGLLDRDIDNPLASTLIRTPKTVSVIEDFRERTRQLLNDPANTVAKPDMISIKKPAQFPPIRLAQGFPTPEVTQIPPGSPNANGRSPGSLSAFKFYPEDFAAGDGESQHNGRTDSELAGDSFSEKLQELVLDEQCDEIYYMSAIEKSDSPAKTLASPEWKSFAGSPEKADCIAHVGSGGVFIPNIDEHADDLTLQSENDDFGDGGTTSLQNKLNQFRARLTGYKGN